MLKSTLIKREEASLLVDLRRSKTSLLKLLIVTAYSLRWDIYLTGVRGRYNTIVLRGRYQTKEAIRGKVGCPLENSKGTDGKLLLPEILISRNCSSVGCLKCFHLYNWSRHP